MSQIVTADVKKSFDDISAADDNLLHNSNMQNLVSAVKTIDEEIRNREAEIVRLNELKAEIKTFAANDDNLQNTTEVQNLHRRASYSFSDSPPKRKRW